MTIIYYKENRITMGSTWLIETSLPEEPKEFYLDMLIVEEKYRKHQRGIELLKKVNAFLDEKGATGILRNGIRKSHRAHNMYENTGWEYMDETNKMKYTPKK